MSAFRLPDSGRHHGEYSIENLAARCVTELVQAQPDGPYHLVGACTGGFVVYEMAQQLLARGKTVGLLALMDCYNHAWGGRLGRVEKLAYRADLLAKRVRYHQRNLRDAGLGGVADYLRPRWTAFGETTRERAEEWAHACMLRARLPLPRVLQDTRLAIRYAAVRYSPPDYPGRLDLFCVAEPRVDAYDYPEMGWQGKARAGIAMHHVSGSHSTMLSEPHVSAIASELLGCLENECFVR